MHLCGVTSSAWLLLCALVIWLALFSHFAIFIFVRDTGSAKDKPASARQQESSDGPTQAPQHSAKLLVLTYAWGTFGQSEAVLRLYTDSLRQTGSNADMVVVTHALNLSNSTKKYLHDQNVQVKTVPSTLVANSTSFANPMLFRFVAWSWYLKAHNSSYTHVMTSDLDVFFQEDPVTCMPNIPMLQVFEENQAITIGQCEVHTKWVQECGGVQGFSGPDILQRIKHRGRICAGLIYGDTLSMSQYLALHAAEAEAQQCNDQGLLNILVWDDKMPRKVLPVVVFHNFYGPVKTTDVGGYRDESGYMLNNYGRRYCMLHQFKLDRAPGYVALLKKQLQGRVNGSTHLFPSVELVDKDDNWFPERVHPSARATTWPPLPANRLGWQSSPWGFSGFFAKEPEWPSLGRLSQKGMAPVNLSR